MAKNEAQCPQPCPSPSSVGPSGSIYSEAFGDIWVHRHLQKPLEQVDTGPVHMTLKAPAMC